MQHILIRVGELHSMVKIAYWGSGPISEFHVPALRAAGFEIATCFSRENSKRLEEFSKKFEIPKASSFDEFLAKIEHCDLIFIALNTSFTVEAIGKVINSGKIIFSEKPGAMHSTELLELDNKFRKNIYFLYNRRFYSTIDRVKSYINSNSNSNSNINININFPDSIPGWKQFIENGCHVIDMLMYIASDFEMGVKAAIGSCSENGSGFSFIGITKNKKINSIIFSNPWGASEKARATINSKTTTLILSPFELLSISNSLEIIPPSQDYPLRRYEPKVSDKILVETNFKPGFYEQANAMMKLYAEGVVDERLATFEQAYCVLQYIEKIKENLE